MVVSREVVFDVISQERDYQDARWDENSTDTEGLHSVTEWLVFMQDYLNEAMHQVSRNGDPEASRLALHTIRKITAMGVACMEQRGALRREFF